LDGHPEFGGIDAGGGSIINIRELNRLLESVGKDEVIYVRRLGV
jgi:hypothetical protein